MTNFGKLKEALTVEKTVAYIIAADYPCDYCAYIDIEECGGLCREGVKKWLEQEYENE